MHSRFLLAAVGLASCLTAGQNVFAGSHNPADFPLRVAILGFIGQNQYQNNEIFGADGEGRANLFENGEAHAMDIHYKCSRQLRTTMGYETFMARWKKPGLVMEMLLPEIGKPGSSSTCQLAVDVRQNQAYVPWEKGQTAVVPAAAYKQWMERAQYDPEHGKNEPLIPLRLNPNNGQPAPSKETTQPGTATSPH